jgi:hypothetical protein
VQLSVVRAAERDGELVAYLATEGPMLSKTEVMSVRRLSTADKAGLLGDKIAMGFIAHAARFRKRQGAFVDADRLWSGSSEPLGPGCWYFADRGLISGMRVGCWRGAHAFFRREIEYCHSRPKFIFDQLSIACG